MERKNLNLGTERVRWDLSHLYSGVDDPQLDADVRQIISLQESFNKKYKGKLSAKLGKALRDLSELRMLDNKLVFLFLLQSLNVDDEKVKAKMNEVQLALSHSQGEYMTFFELEIVALSDRNLNQQYRKDKFLARHKPWIDHIRIFKPHLLSEEVEGALTKRSPFGLSAWSEFYQEMEADLEFVLEGSKKTLVEMLHILTESKDPKEREEALRVINSVFKGSFAKYSAQTLHIVAGLGGVEDHERSYRHPMQSRNKSNKLPDKVVDILHKAVVDYAAPLARRYYKLKGHHLGIEPLKWSDRNAPLPFSDTAHIPFNEALKIVLEAYESFSPTLAAIIRQSVKSELIDAPVVKGKRSGAYNYPLILPGNKAIGFVLLNYLGSNNDVRTLAHELGHNVHGILSGEAQGPLMYDAPMAYAETASTFGEMTTYNSLVKRLREKGDRPALLALIMSKIEDSINTIVRQISFSNFERRVHGMNGSYTAWDKPRKLSVGELNNIWLETTKELYGPDGEVFTYENAEHLWSYVDHFHRPFYVYSYACGDILTQSLYAQQKRLGDKFEPLYLDLLRAGSTKDIMELTEPFGLDPSKESFWKEGINIGLGAMVKEAEEISKEMGISL